MKRLLILAIVCLVPLSVAAIGWLGERAFRDEARAALQAAMPGALIVEWAPARRPETLSREMSAQTIGTSAGYITDNAGAAARLTHSPFAPPALEDQDVRVPLPYPPDEVWCARLRPEGDGRPRVWPVAYHRDLYNGAWIAHKPDDGRLGEISARLDCEWTPP